MPLHIPAFRDVLVQLSGDPIFTKAIAVTPGAGGIAFDGKYFYLNYYQGPEIYVVNTSGTLVNTLALQTITTILIMTQYRTAFGQLTRR